MNKIISILMRRDGLTLEEAKALVLETRDAMLGCDPFEADEVLMDMLGLEPDYLLDMF